MRDIFVVFRSAADADKIKRILMRRGFNVILACSSGARVLAEINELSNGIVVCGYRMSDISYGELASSVPPSFRVLLASARQNVDEAELLENTVYLPMPLKVNDLVSTLETMLSDMHRQRRKARTEHKPRSDEEKKIINQAKDILMERNHMTEPEAHHYLQKCAMDSGTNIVETAEMILTLQAYHV